MDRDKKCSTEFDYSYILQHFKNTARQAIRLISICKCTALPERVFHLQINYDSYKTGAYIIRK